MIDALNHAAPVRRAEGNLAVIKISFPNDEARAEIAALSHFDVRGFLNLFLTIWANTFISSDHIPATQTGSRLRIAERRTTSNATRRTNRVRCATMLTGESP